MSKALYWLSRSRLLQLVALLVLGGAAAAAVLKFMPAAGFIGQSVAVLCAVSITLAAVAVFVGDRATRRSSARLRNALDNMTQGLCMFGPDEKLIVCNRQYLQLYDLSPDIVKPGISLRELLELRIRQGTFTRDPDEYQRTVRAAIAAGKTTANEISAANGDLIAVHNRPMAGGGWVSTHENITDRHNAEIERSAMKAQETRRAAIDAAIAQFRARVEDHVQTVADSAQTMRSTASALLVSSGQTAERAATAVTSSNEASANVETAAAAAEELTGSITEISRQIRATTEIVRKAVGEAADTNLQIKGLSEAAQKIGDVIKLIRAIAGQTNLLALNATIEAARAGETGKGFAVVASEVKSLAVQTARATEEIAGQISEVQNSAKGAVAAIGSISSRMKEIDSFASTVDQAVHQQTSATAEISRNVIEAAAGTKGVVGGLSAVAGAASQTQESAEDVLATSQAVEAAANDLRQAVENFLNKVAA